MEFIWPILSWLAYTILFVLVASFRKGLFNRAEAVSILGTVYISDAVSPPVWWGEVTFNATAKGDSSFGPFDLGLEVAVHPIWRQLQIGRRMSVFEWRREYVAEPDQGGDITIFVDGKDVDLFQERIKLSVSVLWQSHNKTLIPTFTGDTVRRYWCQSQTEDGNTTMFIATPKTGVELIQIGDSWIPMPYSDASCVGLGDIFSQGYRGENNTNAANRDASVRRFY